MSPLARFGLVCIHITPQGDSTLESLIGTLHDMVNAFIQTYASIQLLYFGIIRWEIQFADILLVQAYNWRSASTKSFLIAMIKNPRTKRILSISLLSLGGILMFLAPEDIWIGAILFALGLVVEIAGLVLGHRK